MRARSSSCSCRLLGSISNNYPRDRLRRLSNRQNLLVSARWWRYDLDEGHGGPRDEHLQGARGQGHRHLAGHGVPQTVIDDAFAASREFHATPLELKRSLKINENNIGYLAGTPLRGRNQWPHGHERMRAAMVTYFKTLERLGERVLPILARALGMPAEYFAQFFTNEAHINLRFLHYPPQEIDDDEQFGQGPHTDNSFITMLAREDVPGLAVRLPNGEWMAPPVIPGTFLVNLGNIMKRWSNDRFLSTPHGVLNESGKDRYSIAFFYSPNVDATVECVPTCVSSDNPAR